FPRLRPRPLPGAALPRMYWKVECSEWKLSGTRPPPPGGPFAFRRLWLRLPPRGLCRLRLCRRRRRDIVVHFGGRCAALERVAQVERHVVLLHQVAERLVGQLLKRHHAAARELVERVPGLQIELDALAFGVGHGVPST